jgi:hypothetical protein
MQKPVTVLRKRRVVKEVIQPGLQFPDGAQDSYVLDRFYVRDDKGEKIMGMKPVTVMKEFCDDENCLKEITSNVRRAELVAPWKVSVNVEVDTDDGMKINKTDVLVAEKGVYHRQCLRALLLDKFGKDTDIKGG